MKVKAKILKNAHRVFRVASGDFAGVAFHQMKDGSVIIDASVLGAVNVSLLTQDDPIDKSVLQVQNNVASSSCNRSGSDRGFKLDGKTYQIGDVLPDGWILGPVSPSTNSHLAIEPVKELDTCVTWPQAEAFVNKYRSSGMERARLPDRKELKAIFRELVIKERNVNAMLGVCEVGGSSHYWANRQSDGQGEWAQDMGTGRQDWFYIDRPDAVCARVVRDI
jgi:hypothetical protein